MAPPYVKTLWSTGDLITAALINHLETQYDEMMANATATPTPNKISISDAGGKLDSWITAAKILSNVIFCWNGSDIGTISIVGLVQTADTLLRDMSAYEPMYQYYGAYGTTYRTILASKFVKIAGISTVTIFAKLWANNVGANFEAILMVDIGGQNNFVKSVTSGTPTWVTSANIDVSSLTNGTTYNITISLKNEGLASAYCSGVILTAS